MYLFNDLLAIEFAKRVCVKIEAIEALSDKAET